MIEFMIMIIILLLPSSSLGALFVHFNILFSNLCIKLLVNAAVYTNTAYSMSDT